MDNFDIKELEKQFEKDQEVADLEIKIAKAEAAKLEIIQSIKKSEITILKQKHHIELQNGVIQNAKVKLKEIKKEANNV